MQPISRLLLAFLIILGSGSLALAQVKGNAIYQQRSYSNRIEIPQAVFNQENVLFVDIKAMLNVEATSYVVMFSLTQPGESIEETDQSMNARVEKIRTEVQKLPGTEVYVDMISLLPVYELEENKKIFSPNTYQEVPKGFEMKKNLHIRYERAGDLDQIVTICAQNEVYDIIKVHYVVDDYADRQDSLRTAALSLFNQKLEYYKALGIDVADKRRDISEATNTFFPFERYESYQPFSNTSYDYKASANVEAAEKKLSEYYNPVSFKGYDIILHPEVIEPVVQFTYTLRIKIYLKEEEKPESAVQKPEKEIYLLSPNGELTKIDLN